MFSEAQIGELKLKHGRVRHVVGGDDEWACVLAPPKAADVKMYKHQLHDPAVRADATEILFRKMVVAACIGDADCTAAELLDSYPMAPEGCSDAIGALIGLTATARGKA
jgi:hypothetical protein